MLIGGLLSSFGGLLSVCVCVCVSPAAEWWLSLELLHLQRSSTARLEEEGGGA